MNWKNFFKHLALGLKFWYVENFGPEFPEVAQEIYLVLQKGPFILTDIHAEITLKGKNYSQFRVINALELLINDGYVVQYNSNRLVYYKLTDKPWPLNQK